MNSQESELVLNPNGSVYHLAVKGDDIADHVILVGDPGRVNVVSSYFDSVRFRQKNREFNTVTGMYKGTEITVLSTGIGTDNIDIVVTELDAAVNINPKTRQVNDKLRSLNLIRLGTSGALDTALDVDQIVVSKAAIGLDGVAHFYDAQATTAELELDKAFMQQCNWPEDWNRPYARMASTALFSKFKDLGHSGLTITANGFFGPQGRAIRLPLAQSEMNERYRQFKHGEFTASNYEMECSALYALGKALGHECLTMCVIVANRYAGKFSQDYHSAVKRMIELTLDRIAR